MYRVARHIQQAVADAPLEEVWFAFDHLKPWTRKLEGKRLAAVRTLGKALLLEFAEGQTIYTHNQLYGRWMFCAPDRRPDTGRQLRLALSTARKSALLYSASEIDVLAAEDVDSHPFIRRIGLDVLSSGADVDQVADWIGGRAYAGRQLGHLLLDQSFLAGVGNYLRSEILFVAGLHWSLRPRDLSRGQVLRLAEAIHQLMWRSVRTEGITNTSERVVALKRAGWKRRDYRHFVFGRDGQACFDCDSEIIKVTVSSRRLYSCTSCQPPRS